MWRGSYAQGCAFKEERAARFDASVSISYVCLAVLVLGGGELSKIFQRDASVHGLGSTTGGTANGDYG